MTVVPQVGVNHALSNQSVYSNLGLYYPNGTSIGSQYGLDDSRCADSAELYSAAAPAQTYVEDLAPAGSCLSPVCVEMDFGTAENFTVITRAVLNPATETGPAAVDIVSPLLMQFA